MSLHSFPRCWINLTWATLRRERVLAKRAAIEVSGFLSDHAKRKGGYKAINYVNPEHVHALIDLPTAYSVEQVVQLLKRASSHCIHRNTPIPGRFRRGPGYAAVSAPHSEV